MEIKNKLTWGDENEDGEEEEYSAYKFLLVPGCCEESVAARRPYLYLNFGHEDTGEPENVDDAVPEWRIPNLDWDFIHSLAEDAWDGKSYKKTLIPVKFCPFCGKKLPKVRRKEVPPEEPVYVDADGGYYCATCDERNMNCGCLPREALFEVVDEDK